MNQYMVTFELPVPFSDGFIAGIPAQRRVINELLAEQRMQSYSLAMERDRLWCLMNATNEIEVIQMVNSFPLIDFMTYEISELMFHNVASMHVPAFSLN